MNLIQPAQTNLQLYRQLVEAGWTEEDLGAVRRAYELAQRLHTSAFRANGKPFLAHLVGTASILAHLGFPVRVVATGLLHGAYVHGEFGCGTRGIASRKRKAVAGAVGEDVEALVFEYARFPWSRQAVAELAERGPTDAEAETVALKLANELEDHLDWGEQYRSDDKAEEFAPVYARMVSLARRLNQEELAEALERVFREARPVPSALRTGRPSSFLLPPASHGLKARVRFRRLRHRLRKIARPRRR